MCWTCFIFFCFVFTSDCWEAQRGYDLIAQLVEPYTFNVVVDGSSPSKVTNT